MGERDFFETRGLRVAARHERVVGGAGAKWDISERAKHCLEDGL